MGVKSWLAEWMVMLKVEHRYILDWLVEYDIVI
jgi:hypothetical protein